MCEKHGPVVNNLGDDDVTYYKKHVCYVDSVVGNLEEVDVIHVDFRETLSSREKLRGRRRSPWPDYEKLNPVVENLGDVHLIHVDLRKHVPVVKNLGHNDIVHVDYEKHDPIVRNLEDDEVRHVNWKKYGPVMRILAFVELIILLRFKRNLVWSWKTLKCTK